MDLGWSGNLHSPLQPRAPTKGAWSGLIYSLQLLLLSVYRSRQAGRQDVIFSTPPPQGREEEVIRQVEGLRRQLRHHVADLRSWTGSIHRLALARAVQASNTIEGINMTLDDVLAVTGGNEPLESDHETLAAVAGYRDAMTYVLQLSDDPHFDYSEALIRSLHFMIVKHDLRKSPGRWRRARSISTAETK